MKAIMVMYDSLNRRYLPPYGNDWVHAPNFQRLAERSVAFQNAYVGSMPCMPARRELHTGRYNFLHRSWGPLEPFDDAMPEILKQHGVSTHLISDHQHYWEDGGATYHTRYSTWEAVRGQEGDQWKANLTAEVPFPSDSLNRRPAQWLRQDWVNRYYMQREEDQPQPKTFAAALDFIRTNYRADHWFLQIETFDPHEPYFVSQKYKDLYPHRYQGPHYDWPPYGRVTEDPETVQHLRYENAALVSMCDAYLGQVLDLMDALDLWRDTLLIVNTDHGFLLGERGWWAKCVMPFYNEIAHIPLFIWDPRCGRAGARVDALVQTIDLAPTLLDFFGVACPPDMQGAPLGETVATGKPVREAGLFGLFGAHVNVTDGRYVYMRGPATPEDAPLFEYTLMPTHMRSLFAPEELREATMGAPFSFTKGVPVMRIPARRSANPDLVARELGHMLFDLRADPGQEYPLNDPDVEKRMIEHLVRLMRENDAPPEQFERLGL